MMSEESFKFCGGKGKRFNKRYSLFHSWKKSKKRKCTSGESGSRDGWNIDSKGIILNSTPCREMKMMNSLLMYINRRNSKECITFFNELARRWTEPGEMKKRWKKTECISTVKFFREPTQKSSTEKGIWEFSFQTSAFYSENKVLFKIQTKINS